MVHFRAKSDNFSYSAPRIAGSFVTLLEICLDTFCNPIRIAPEYRLITINFQKLLFFLTIFLISYYSFLFQLQSRLEKMISEQDDKISQQVESLEESMGLKSGSKSPGSKKKK